MAVTVIATQDTGSTGTSGRCSIAENNEGASSRFYYLHPHGNILSIWNIVAPDTLSFLMEFDMTSFAIPQVNVKLINPQLVNNGQSFRVINYDPAGNCYNMPYLVSSNGAGLITGITQDTANAVLLSGAALDDTVNQWTSTPTPFAPTGDDIIAGFASNSYSVTVADTPGNGCHAVTYAQFGTPAKVFATALNDHRLKAFTLNGGTGQWDTPDFDVDTGGDQALNITFVPDNFVAVIVKSGSTYFVKLFAYADGAPLGVYEHLLPGALTDMRPFNGCLLCTVTGVSSNNLLHINVTDTSNPFLALSSTIPSGTGYNLETVEVVSNLGYVVIGNVSGSDEAAIANVDFGDCPSAPVVSSGFASCFSLGAFLFVADNVGSALKVYTLIDPTSPTLVATLSLGNPPTDVVLLDTLAYLIAGDTIYGINIDDIENPEQVIEKADVSGDFLLNAGGNLWASGETMGLRVFSVDKGEDGLTIEKYLPPPSTGVSRPAFTRDRIIFADVPDTETAFLRSYKFGGFTCHNVKVGHVGAYESDSEVLRARVGDIRQLSTNALEVTGTTGAAFDGSIKIGGREIFSCTGSPEGVIAAGPGSLALSDSGAVYRKDTGTGMTGWTTV